MFDKGGQSCTHVSFLAIRPVLDLVIVAAPKLKSSLSLGPFHHATHSLHNYHRGMDEKPKLSCVQCKRRKIKCDKFHPCSACRTAGLSCEIVQRERLPRGRTAKVQKKSSQLETRVARIEKLLHLVAPPAFIVDSPQN